MENNKTITVSLVKVEDGLAYDVKIEYEKATLWQYIETLDRFLDERVAPCLGCDNCCYQRIPLTLPDIYHYAGQEKAGISAFLNKSAVMEKDGPALDVKLRQGEEGICIFLDGDEQRCTDYPHRSLVCHTYICLPQTSRAREMREHLINEGEDALIGVLFQLGLCEGYEDLAAAYPIKPQWQGKHYDEILLKDVLPAELWETMTAPSAFETIG